MLEKIRAATGMSKEDMVEEIKRRVKILEWMRREKVRSYKEVAKIVAEYSENPEEVMRRVEEGLRRNASK